MTAIARRETLLVVVLWSTSAYIAWTKAILHIKRASLTMPSLFQRAWPKKPAHATKTGIYFTIGNSKSFCIQSVKGNRCMKVSNVGRKPHRKKIERILERLFHLACSQFLSWVESVTKSNKQNAKIIPHIRSKSAVKHWAMQDTAACFSHLLAVTANVPKRTFIICLTTRAASQSHFALNFDISRDGVSPK